MKANHKVQKSYCADTSTNSSLLSVLNLAVGTVLYLCSTTVAKICISETVYNCFFFDGMPLTTLYTPALPWKNDPILILKCGNDIPLITHTHTFLLSPVKIEV